MDLTETPSPGGSATELQYRGAGLFRAVTGSSVDGSGNVTLGGSLGVGVTGGRAFQLEVHGDDDPVGGHIAATGRAAALVWGDRSSYATDPSAYWAWYAAGGATSLYDNHSGANRLTVDASGNLGVGTSSPSARLDVAGAVNATGYAVGGTAGWTGTFAAGDGRTVTVSHGLITGVA